MFLAQTGVETLKFLSFTERSSGQQYEGRKDLGNTHKGDGPRFRGRGALQITGRANYTSATTDLAHDFVNNPNDAADSKFAFTVASWFWDKKLQGRSTANLSDVAAFTKIIRGGLGAGAHLDQRQKFYQLAMKKL
jgi:putative chitinase